MGFSGLKCPPGAVGYVYDANRRLHIIGQAPEDVRRDILARLQRAKTVNEVGCYMPGGYAPGDYRVSASFTIHPPLACGGSACLMDLNLAGSGRHVTYLDVAFRARGAMKVGAGPDPAFLGATMDRPGGDSWVLRLDRLPGRATLDVYLLLPAGYSQWAGRVESVPNATSRFESLVARAELRVEIAQWLPWLLAAVPAIPGVLAAVQYALYGRESEPRMPIPRGFPPQTGEKPWEVALLYSGDPGASGENVYAATAAYMVSRGRLRLETCNGEEGLAPGERPPSWDSGVERALYELVSLFKRHTGRPLCKATVAKAARDPQARRALTEAVRRLEREADELGSRLAEKALEAPSWKPLGAYTLALLALSAAAALLLPDTFKPAVAAAAAAGIGSAVAYILLPSHVLGRWKPGYLERYLAWREFRTVIAERRLDKVPGPQLEAIGDLAAYAAAMGVLRGLPESRSVRAALAAYNAVRAVYW